MNIREISAEEITLAVKKLFMDCNYYIGEDISQAIENAQKTKNCKLRKMFCSS